MKKYTLNTDNYSGEDVNNALPLRFMSLYLEKDEDTKTYIILRHNLGIFIKNRIIDLGNTYKNQLNQINNKENEPKKNKKSENTFLKRCIRWTNNFGKKNKKYTHQFNLHYTHILVQLFQAYKLNKMLWISRDNNSYVKKRTERYFYNTFNNELLCLIFDIMEDLKYIDGIGFEKGTKYVYGRASRYMPSGICRTFNKINGKCSFELIKSDEVVFLKEEKVKYKEIKTKKGGYIYVEDTIKKLKNYIDDDFTNNRRAFIKKLNNLYSFKKIEVKANNIILKNSTLPVLYNLIINKRIILHQLFIEKVNDNNKGSFAIDNMVNEGYKVKEINFVDNNKFLDKKRYLCQKMADKKNLDYQKVYDGHVFIKNLKFEILDKSVRSIFNRGSFNYGGRFYGSVVSELPKILRKCLLIDGEPVLSGDFKAFHIYLAYHLAGEACPMVDPYKLPGTSREEMKLASLVAINAPDLDFAVFGTMNKINSSLSKYKADSKQITEEHAECMITTFIENHPKLLDKVASDYGVTLQNRDSIIMQDALDTLMDEGICGLGVHDEIIVPAKRIDRAVEIMIQAYKKQPFTHGFEPIVEVDRKRA